MMHHQGIICRSTGSRSKERPPGRATGKILLEIAIDNLIDMGFILTRQSTMAG